MSKSHQQRMREIGSIAIPPKGTHARELLEKILKEKETPERKKYLKQLFEKARSIVVGQQLNGAGNETDQALRYFQGDYNNRIWNHDLHAIPSTCNVVEAFLHYNPKLNTFILHDECNHLFSFSEFVNWYTSENLELNPQIALEAFEPGIIYTFDNFLDPADMLYGIERESDVGVSGFAMVRFGSEISILCVAGETEDLQQKTKELIENLQKMEYAESREEIKPDPSLSTEAVPLKSKGPLWKLIALTRFDLSEMSQSVRYICHDIGTSFLIKTDDPSVFLNMKGDFADKSLENVAKTSAKELRGYNALFDLCSTAIFLPLYFEKFAENVEVERTKTRYANEANKASFLKIKKNMPHSIKLAYRNINILRHESGGFDNTSIIYSIPNFHIETSGYWRTLTPGKMGTDKNGNPVHGRTWVSKKLSWMEADEPNALIARKEVANTFPKGPNPGYVYVMRAPIQPPNVFKVGLTQRTSAIRANELSKASGVPGKIYVMHEWAVGDCVFAKKEIHKQLSEFRVDPRREFFEAPLELIVQIIENTINTLEKKS